MRLSIVVGLIGAVLPLRSVEYDGAAVDSLNWLVQVLRDL